jgi:tRNA-dihydrouridine synthase B
MKLRSRELGRLFLAPLSGVADSSFRRTCKRYGADTVYSEMVSCEGLSRGNVRTRDVIRFHAEERPIGIQIFGTDPARMAVGAAIVSETAPDFIDINMSCPARKIVSKGAGCALMREPEKACRVAAAVVGSTDLAVTVKLRIGWDEEEINALELARGLEEVGVEAISVHGRTCKQGFRDVSSWSDVAKVKAGTTVPVILTGDVATPEDARRAFEETGCDALMVGRASYGRPWIFSAVRAYLEGRPYTAPGREEITGTVLSHLDMGIDQFGERLAVVRFRKHLLWYTKGIPGVVALRPAMSTVTTRQDVRTILLEIFPGG